MKYPTSVFLIVSSEFCERFCYFNLQTTLPLYLVDILHFPQDMAIVIFHAFVMLVFFFPLMGGIIADSWLGNYRTILYLSIVYASGQFLLVASSTPWFHLPIREISLLGLFLIALGSGGIKPCVSVFGCEQFKLPEQEDQIPGFIMFFFLMIASSSVLSTFISPILRKDIFCFGMNNCYPLAFLVPFIFMVLVVAIFFLGKPLYKLRKPEGNVMLEVSKCVTYAIMYKLKSKEKRVHWLDHADCKCDRQLIEDIKGVLGVFKLYVLLSVYFSVFEQTHSRWTFQATQMSGNFFGYLIKADQLHVFQYIMALIFIPSCQYIIYPIIGKFLFINTPLRKLTFGGILVATSFIVSGVLELSLESTYTVQPSTGLAQIRVFNTINCPANLAFEDQMQEVEALGLYQKLNIPVKENVSLMFNVEVKCPDLDCPKFTDRIWIEEKKSLTYLLKNDSLQFGLVDKIEKSKSGDTLIRALILNDAGMPTNLNLSIQGKNSYYFNLAGNKLFTEFIEVIDDSYKISIDGDLMESEVSLRLGGIYTIVGRVTNDSKVINTVIVHKPNSINILWQVPQYILASLSEIIISMTGLQFAISQAPASMKSVVVAGWFLSSAIGNLIVIVIQKANFFQRQVFEYFLFAGLLYVDMLIFAIMAMFYKYVDSQTPDEKTTSVEINEQAKEK